MILKASLFPYIFCNSSLHFSCLGKAGGLVRAKESAIGYVSKDTVKRKMLPFGFDDDEFLVHNSDTEDQSLVSTGR